MLKTLGEFLGEFNQVLAGAIKSALRNTFSSLICLDRDQINTLGYSHQVKVTFMQRDITMLYLAASEQDLNDA